MSKLKKYALEFLSIFIAVISAFALNNWNDNRRDSEAELKILIEISNGLKKDYEDVGLNKRGHYKGISACNFWSKVFTDKNPNLDSLENHYFMLTRDFISIQNSSGYETLKSRGFELIENDSLRTKIISLYEYDYQLLRKLEEEYDEMQFHDNYFHELNKSISLNLQYNVEGKISGIELPLNLNEKDKKFLLSHLWKIRRNRNFILDAYKQIEEKIEVLRNEIALEIGR